MKSIEERGQIAGQTYQFCKKEIEADHKIYEKGYIKGATEQKAIDIEKAKEAFNKACEYLRKEYEQMNKLFELISYRYNLIDIDASVKNFIKAMEE